MDNSRHPHNPVTEDLVTQTTVDGVEPQLEPEFGCNADWEPLEAALSWESEQAVTGNVDLRSEPSLYLSPSPFASCDTATSPLLGPRQDPMPLIQDRPFVSDQFSGYSGPHYPLWGLLNEDLMKIHEKQVAAKRERRKAQNRKAQQAYRERREQQVETLRDRIAAAEKACENQARQSRDLQGSLAKVKAERESLLKQLRRPSLPLCARSGSGIESDSPDQDDLLAYGTSRRFSLSSDPARTRSVYQSN